ASLPLAPPPPEPREESFEPPDPRGPEAEKRAREREERRIARLVAEGKVTQATRPQRAPPPAKAPEPRADGVRTALCVEPRGGTLYVFLPPVAAAQDFLRIVEAVDGARSDLRLPVLLEGYPPPRSAELSGFS